MASARARNPKPNPLAAIVDELGDLEKELAPLQAKIARVRALREALREKQSLVPASQSVQVNGDRFVAVFSERRFESVIDVSRLAKEIGLRNFVAIAAVTLKSLQAAVHADVVLSVVSQAQIGPRVLNILEKGKPA